MGPKTYIAYGFAHMYDVNVLTHICGVPISDEHKLTIDELKERHAKQDLKELFCSDSKALEKSSEEVQNLETDDGALWDIFRRDNVPKLEKYLVKHHKECRHIYCNPLSHVVHPIHDQTFYLTKYHKRKLKEEYGIEPWTIVQKLGDAVLVPAGCPHQVRNLKVLLFHVVLHKGSHGFVSPESVGEFLRLANEYCLLPPTNYSKEEKLGIKKTIFSATEKALKVLNPNER